MTILCLLPLFVFLVTYGLFRLTQKFTAEFALKGARWAAIKVATAIAFVVTAIVMNESNKRS